MRRPTFLARALVLTSVFIFCQFADARKKESLQAQIEKLQQGQQQIVDELEALKQLLAANAALRSAPQSPPPPSVVDTQNEAFRGQAGAQIAIVEYADFDCSLVHPGLVKNSAAPASGLAQADSYPVGRVEDWRRAP